MIMTSNALEIVTELAESNPLNVFRLLTVRQRARSYITRLQNRRHPMGLTEREEDCYRFLLRQGRGKPLSTRLIADFLVLSDSWTYKLLASLRDKGYVERVGKRTGGGWVLIDRSLADEDMLRAA